MNDRTTLPVASVDRIIRNACPDARVAEESGKELAYILEEYAKKISTEALKVCLHAGRQTIRPEDIKLAVLRVK